MGIFDEGWFLRGRIEIMPDRQAVLPEVYIVRGLRSCQLVVQLTNLVNYIPNLHIQYVT